MNLFSILEESARNWPEGAAVVHDGRSFSYSELHRAAESLALKLRQIGVKVGDKVGVICQNNPEYIAAFFAVLRAGGIVVSISPALKSSEVAALALEIGFDAFCFSTKFASLIPAGSGETLTEAPIFEGGIPSCIKLAPTRLTPKSERDQLLKIDAASIGFSSGTTSRAKGVVLSHATILERIELRPRTYSGAKPGCVLWLRPMDPFPYQTFGGCLLQGGKMLLADSLALKPLPRLIREHGVDQIHASPLFFRALMQEGWNEEALRGVRYFISTGSPLPASISEAFRSRFGGEIGQVYGLTECAAVLINSGEATSKSGSLGKPAPGRQIRLAPSDSGAAAAEEVGEILVRGPGLFDAYYKPWQLRDEALEDGWFKTGDVARRDADGYYWIVGRTKGVINVGGVKVFPYEVEEVLLKHPAVEEAVVFGVTDARFGEVPHGNVKLRAGTQCTERELLRFANERLSVFKALRAVEFVNEIPKTVTGKPKRSGISESRTV